MSRPDLLRITVEPLEDARLIRAAGEIDPSTVAQLARELDTAREQATTAVLDLSDVTFIDSSGLHLLLFASDSSEATGWGFSIVRPSRLVRRLIEVSRTADRLRLVGPGSSASASENGSSPARALA